jgi:hypothetical protein
MDYYNEQNGWVLWKLIKVVQKLTTTRNNLLICNWSALYGKIKPATVIMKCSMKFSKNQLTIQAHMVTISLKCGTKWKLHSFIDSPSKVDPWQWTEPYESSRVVILGNLPWAKDATTWRKTCKEMHVDMCILYCVDNLMKVWTNELHTTRV